MSAMPISESTSFSEDEVLMENFGTWTLYTLGRPEDKHKLMLILTQQSGVCS